METSLRSLFRVAAARQNQKKIQRDVIVAPRNDLMVCGSDYGAVVVPESLISADSICYSAGIGEDITFDLGLISRFGCQVHAFDPTPKSIKFVEDNVRYEPRFVFHPYGIWSEDTKAKFYAPKNPIHVSHSVHNIQGSSSFFEADVKSLSTVMRELGHNRIDLLKLDVEGAEFPVLEDAIEKEIEIGVICAEFHFRTDPSKTLNMNQRLRAHGFVPVSVRGWNVTFVRV